MKNLVTFKHTESLTRVGHVDQFSGLLIESQGPPDAFVGEVCKLHVTEQSPIEAEVMGFREGKVLLMPVGRPAGIRQNARVVGSGRPASVPVSKHLNGRILDARGRPIDGKPLQQEGSYPLYPQPISPLERDRIHQILTTGIPLIDGFLTLGRGQRMGIFSGSGVGKSTLLGTIARYVNSDINVIALIGERGREVREFIEDVLGNEGLKKSIVVVATADQPALERVRAAYSAHAIAEYYRDQNKNVVLMMDSITRFAMAQREIGLALGEPPTARGYTPSVFAQLPHLLERGGNLKNKGSITAFYTILVEGDDFNEPLSDQVRAIVDGHIVLTRERLQEGKLPPIDLLKSLSRLWNHLVSSEDREWLRKGLELFQIHQRHRDMIDMGMYEAGKNLKLDRALTIVPKLEQFLYQTPQEFCSREKTLQTLKAIIRE